MNIKFWVDPVCPWCWMTARWAVDLVQPQRDLNIEWQPISLLLKNQPGEDSPFYKPLVHTHGLLRVLEAVRAAEGNDAVHAFYWAAGTAIHHDQATFTPAADILTAAGLDTRHAEAADDEALDAVIQKSMDRAFELVGTDVGTPIIEFPTKDGDTRGIFGPVISEFPSEEDALTLWDAMSTLATMNGFWELKRTRTVGPTFPPRPQ